MTHFIHTRTDDNNKMIPKDGVVLIDWNTGGHHETYLREYIATFSKSGKVLVVMCPEDPKLDPKIKNVTWCSIPEIRWLKKNQQIGMTVARWRYAKLIASELHQVEKKHNVKCSGVFFACLYENQSKLFIACMEALKLPAGGLYIHVGVLHADRHLTQSKLYDKVCLMLRQPLLERIFILDEGMIDEVSKFSGKTVTHLPDITDYRVNEDDSLPRELGLIPKTRPVIGLLGHLRPSKGVADMITLARTTPDLNVTFLLAGSCNWNEFSEDEQALIQKAIGEDERIVFYPHRIPDEMSYNALVRACDVLWAVYRESPHSSNTLTKAAYFERPVVVAEGHLMSKRTRQYSLGAVVKYTDTQSLRDTIKPLIKDPAAWIAKHKPQWDEYRKEHCNERFREILLAWVAS